jgi:hypothetical protein
MITRNTESLTDTSMEAGLEVNAKKSKYMFPSHHYIKCKSWRKNSYHILRKCGTGQLFGNIHKRNKYLIQEEINRRMNVGDTCYFSVQ